MRMIIQVLGLVTFFLASVMADTPNLFQERIWKLQAKKRSIFLESGIFHRRSAIKDSSLVAVRHSFNKGKNQERIVFDFNSDDIPSVYGHISAKDMKLYVDFIGSGLNPALGSFGRSHYVEKMDVFPIENLSVELKLRKKITADIFYLKNPGRLVIDLRE